MAKKAVVLLIALVLVLGVTSAAWAQTPPVGTSIATPLVGSTSVAATPSLTLEWITPPPSAAYVNIPFTVAAKATNTGAEIPKVLYIVEIMKNNQPASQADVDIIGTDQTGTWPLGYDTSVPNRPFFYWGPRNGFTFPAGTTATPATLEAKFTVTFKNPGTYSFTIYAVILQ